MAEFSMNWENKVHCLYHSMINALWETTISFAFLFAFLSHRRKQAEQEEELRRKEKLKWVSEKMCQTFAYKMMQSPFGKSGQAMSFYGALPSGKIDTAAGLWLWSLVRLA